MFTWRLLFSTLETPNLFQWKLIKSTPLDIFGTFTFLELWDFDINLFDDKIRLILSQVGEVCALFHTYIHKKSFILWNTQNSFSGFYGICCELGREGVLLFIEC